MDLARPTRHPGLIAAASATLLLVGCASDNRTVGQKIDSAIATSERTADSVADRVNKAVGTATASAADAAITTSINAELAKDPRLSLFRIDVDTSRGRVTLSGTAPDAESRLRATRLAEGVKGVTHVENRLKTGG